MKKNILFFILSILVTVANTQTNTATGTQVTPGIEVPSIVSSKFNTDFPNISPAWQLNGDWYYAESRDVDTNLGRIVVYDRYGNIIRTDNEMDSSQYPANITAYQSETYPNENYKVWISYDDKGNKSYYSKNRSGNISWFDKNSKHLDIKTN